MEVIEFLCNGLATILTVAFVLTFIYTVWFIIQYIFFSKKSFDVNKLFAKNGYPVGYVIDKCIIAVDENDNCNGCYFHNKSVVKKSCIKNSKYGPCSRSNRQDKQSIIFKSYEKREIKSN